MHYFTTLLRCICLSSCVATAILLGRFSQAGSVSKSVVAFSLHAQDAGTSRYAKLNKKFLEEIKTIQDESLRANYEQGIYALHRMAQRDRTNKAILEKLVQHQDQTLELFRVCGEQNFHKSFRWESLSHSLFWKRPDHSYLGLLVCNTGTANRRFVPFLYWEEKNEVHLTPLVLSRFERTNGKIHRVDRELTFGWKFPDSERWYDPEKEELRIWTRLGGGAEACGTKATYRLQDKQLVLREFRARFECDPQKKVDYEKLYPM